MAYEAYNAFQSVNSGTPRELFREGLQQLVDSQFESAPNYLVVKKLNNTTGLFEDIGVRLVQAFEVDGKDMVSSDDTVTIEFQDMEQSDIYVGDMYEFKGYRWLSVESKTVATLCKSCMVKRCNGLLNFVESTPLTNYIGATPLVGHIISIDALLSVKIKNPDTNQYIILPQGEMVARIPYNANSKKIKYAAGKGTRFLIGDPVQAWQCINVDSVSGVRLAADTTVEDSGIVELRLKLVGIDNVRDNLVDKVAWQEYFIR